LRYSVESAPELLSAGTTMEEVLADHPDLSATASRPRSRFGARAAGRCMVPLTTA
jgi:uncharacterized protein (DUF433 family)